MRRATAAVLRPTLAMFVLSAGAALTGACASEDASYSAAKQIQSNPTPGLQTLAQRPVDVDNAIAITNDTNLRMANEDLGRMFFFDRPSRLTFSPMPH